MTKGTRLTNMTERERQLVNARRACLLLIGYAIGEDPIVLLPTDEETRELIADLFEQFARLDRKEQLQRKAGKKGAIHGRKGGRPKKANNE